MSGRYIIRKRSPLDRFISFCYTITDSANTFRMIAEIVVTFGIISLLALLATRTYVTGHGWVSDYQVIELYDRANGGGDRQ